MQSQSVTRHGRPSTSPASGALAGIRVIELSGGVAPAYCSKLMADLGADVVKLEPPEGAAERRAGPFPSDIPDGEQSGLNLYLNTNKLGVTLDIRRETGRMLLHRLLERANLLVHDLPPARAEALALDYGGLNKRHALLVLVQISAFGATGRYRNFKGDDLIAFAMSGYAAITTRGVEDLRKLPPLTGPFHSASLLTGATAATGALAALRRRQRTGHGGLVDVALWEALATALPQELAHVLEGTHSRDRSAPDLLARSLVYVLPCRDGVVAVSPREEHLWRRWLELLGNPEWAAEERFRDHASRSTHWDAAWEHLACYTRPRNKQEIVEAAQAHRVPAFPLSTVADLVADPQLRYRNFFVQSTHPVAGVKSIPSAPYRFSATPWAVRRPAPLLGEHNAAIYGMELGLSHTEMVDLRHLGVI